tara:strand:+ start:35 stop:160 length:126 start_codon:yes stop_codon:yes gene_type:complete
MAWNWQNQNWPEFIYNEVGFVEFERKFIEKAGIIQGSPGPS